MTKLFCIDCHQTFEDATVTEKQVVRGRQVDVTRVKSAIEFADRHGLQHPDKENTIPKHHHIFKVEEK